jgi:small subunit ribosomal protein S6
VPDYEILVIFDPTLTEEQILEEVEKLKALVAEHKSEVSKVDVWGKRKLAYQIKKKREGFYVQMNFALESGGGALIEEINRRLRIAENVLRHMVVKSPPPKPVEKKEETAAEQPADAVAAEAAAPAVESEPREAEPAPSERSDEQDTSLAETQKLPPHDVAE